LLNTDATVLSNAYVPEDVAQIRSKYT